MGSIWHKSRLNQGISTENMAYGPRNMAYEPPPFMPFEPFLLGVGVVFNFLKFPASGKRETGQQASITS